MVGNLKELINGTKGDAIRIDRFLRLLMHLDSVMCNAVFDLNEELKNGKLLRQEIKHNIKEIRRKLKTNLKGDWVKLESYEGFTDEFYNNAKKFEHICYNFFRLGEGMNVNVEISHPIGSIVWAKLPDEVVSCKVKRVEIQMVVNDNSGKIEDKSYYVLVVLNKDNKETNRIIYCGAESLYKHKKDIPNENL